MKRFLSPFISFLCNYIPADTGTVKNIISFRFKMQLNYENDWPHVKYFLISLISSLDELSPATYCHLIEHS